VVVAETLLKDAEPLRTSTNKSAIVREDVTLMAVAEADAERSALEDTICPVLWDAQGQSFAPVAVKTE